MASLDKYINSIQKGELDYEIEELDIYTRYNDFVITTIRTHWGMSLSHLRSTYGENLYQYCLRMAKPHLEQGVLEIKEDTFEAAVKTAASKAKEGEAVLLSPACASWGMFPNYEVRNGSRYL